MSRPGPKPYITSMWCAHGNRDGLIDYLKGKGIGTGIHYPIPLHLQKPYAFLNYTREDLPVAVRVATEIVSIPMFPQLSAERQARVAREILAFTHEHSSEAVNSVESALTGD